MDVRRFLIRVAAEIGEALGDCLSGIYVHGSLATGSFVRSASDLDFLVLVEGPLTGARLRALEQTLRNLEASRPVPGALEVTVLQRRYALHYEHPAKAELQFNSRPALIAAQLVHARQHAVRLTGARPEDAIGVLPWHAFMQSVLDDFDAHAKPGTQNAAVILNACRTLHDATVKQVTVLDKFSAAQWALERVPERFKPIIAAAAQARQAGVDAGVPRAEIEEFRAYVRAQADPAFQKVLDVDEDGEDERQ